MSQRSGRLLAWQPSQGEGKGGGHDPRQTSPEANQGAGGGWRLLRLQEGLLLAWISQLGKYYSWARLERNNKQRVLQMEKLIQAQ